MLSTRDSRSDGSFVWVALSTNIYCRPSCGARRPGRHRVLVPPGTADAERRGYSACRRCQPDTTAVSAGESGVVAALVYIRQHPDERITLEHLARMVGLSANHFQRLFTHALGMSPREYRDHCRLARLKDLLRSGASVADFAYGAGYGSISREVPRAFLERQTVPVRTLNEMARRCALSGPIFSRLSLEIRQDIFRARLMRMLAFGHPRFAEAATVTGPRV